MAQTAKEMIPIESLGKVRDRESLFAFLSDQLGWPVDTSDSFTYEGPSLGDIAGTRVEVSQIVPFTAEDPFLIMLAEFNEGFRRGDLREILRAVRAEMRNRGKHSNKALEDIVFVCAIENYQGIRFARFEENDKRQPKLSVFGWDRDQTGQTRTLCEINLPKLAMPQTILFDEVDWQLVRRQWLEAWSIERVTNAFFREFRRQFRELESYLAGQTGDLQWAHDFALQAFSRVMFVYFIQRKQRLDGTYWLGNDRGFISALWGSYRNANQPTNTFYSEWLSVLFFEAFNNRFQAGRADYTRRFPQAIRDALATAPYPI